MKIRKGIALFMAVCSCLAFTSCQSGTKAEEDSFTAIYTFENTIRPVGMHNLFGVVSLNDDPEYVSEGKQSIKLAAMADKEEYLYAYFPFRSDFLKINNTDLTQVASVKTDIYAAEEMSVGIGFYFSTKAELRTEAKSFKLKKGWNTVQVPVEHSLIAIQYDLAECNGLYVQFEEGAGTKKSTIYLDNIQLEKTREEVVVEQDVFLLEEDGYCELADFEHAYQQLLATPYTSYNRADLANVKVVNASDYGLEAPSGKKVLRVESHPCRENFGQGTSWTQLFFTDQWLETLDISRFAGKEDYVLKFSVYLEKDMEMLLELNLYSESGMDWGGIQMKTGEWLEYSAPLSNFKNFVEKPSRFAFAWIDWDPALGDSAVFYLDNLRIEKE